MARVRGSSARHPGSQSPRRQTSFLPRDAMVVLYAGVDNFCIGVSVYRPLSVFKTSKSTDILKLVADTSLRQLAGTLTPIFA